MVKHAFEKRVNFMITFHLKHTQSVRVNLNFVGAEKRCQSLLLSVSREDMERESSTEHKRQFQDSNMGITVSSIQCKLHFDCAS